MTQASTAGHGPSRGYSSMNNHLKRYFRGKKGDEHQKRMDRAFTRSGPLAKARHGAALRFGSEAIKKVRLAFKSGASKAELRKLYGLSKAQLDRMLG